MGDLQRFVDAESIVPAQAYVLNGPSALIAEVDEESIDISVSVN